MAVLITAELVLSLIGSALGGAATAWLSNKVVNAELWGHVKSHCRELKEIKDSTKSSVGDIHGRLDAHARDLRMVVRDVAVLYDREDREDRKRGTRGDEIR